MEKFGHFQNKQALSCSQREPKLPDSCCDANEATILAAARLLSNDDVTGDDVDTLGEDTSERASLGDKRFEHGGESCRDVMSMSPAPV